MLNNILKVYGEDLASGALNQAAIAAGDAVAAGSTQGALCVNAFAVGDVATTAAGAARRCGTGRLGWYGGAGAVLLCNLLSGQSIVRRAGGNVCPITVRTGQYG